jgi:hypothetical protein
LGLQQGARRLSEVTNRSFGVPVHRSAHFNQTADWEIGP